MTYESESMDYLEILRIDLAASRIRANRGDLDNNIPMGVQITEDDIKAAILEFYGNEPEYAPWMINVLLRIYKTSKEEHDSVSQMMTEVFTPLFPNLGRFI